MDKLLFDMIEEHLSLSELNQLIKEAIELNFVDGCWVVAEIASLKMATAGHCYLELVEKDNNKTKAKIRANCWSFVYQSIAPKFFRVTGQPIQEGMKVLLFCEVTFHELYGVSLTVKGIDPNFTLGEMARRKKEILDRLEKEGLINKNKRHELPIVVQRIAIISSETAAGYEDFMNQMESNDYGFQFYYTLFHSVMQGEKTVSSIISALDQIKSSEESFDAVVIIRGGGSTIDLNSFDSYELGKSVAEFSLPVLSGIGHERDDSVVDYVAHTRLKTPTAVANFIIDLALDFWSSINEIKDDLISLTKNTIRDNKRSVDNLITEIRYFTNKHIADKKIVIDRKQISLVKGSSSLIEKLNYQLNSEFKNIDNTVKHKLFEQEGAIDKLSLKLQMSSNNILSKSKDKLKNKEQFVYLNDPVRLLEKGYSLVYKEGLLQKSVSAINKGDGLEIHLKDGKLKTRVE